MPTPQPSMEEGHVQMATRVTFTEPARDALLRVVPW
jgi:hypothetical protein